MEKDDLYYQLIGGRKDGNGAANLFTSKDLYHWEFVSTIYSNGTPVKYWELPYLLELDGKAILMAGADALPSNPFRNPYWVGQFDYETGVFTPDDPNPKNADTGNYYSYNPSMIDGNGRRIMFGWVNGFGLISKDPEIPYWDGMHSIPREISIQNDVLSQRPVPEIEDLKYENKTFGTVELSQNAPFLFRDTSDSYELQLHLKPNALTSEVRIECLSQQADKKTAAPGAVVRILPNGDVIFEGDMTFKTEAMFHPQQETTFRIFVDRSVFEIYAQKNTALSRAMTGLSFLDKGQRRGGVSISGDGILSDVCVEKMRCIWDDEIY